MKIFNNTTELKTNNLNKNKMGKVVKVISDFMGNKWDAYIIIGRVTIVKNGVGNFVQMFCADETGWTFGSGIVQEFDSIQDAVNNIHPKNI